MQILYLSQLVPYPPNAGPKVRSYHVLKHLATGGHEVSLVAFRRDSDHRQHIDHMRQYCTAVCMAPMKRSRRSNLWHLARSVLSGEPFLIARDQVAEMYQIIEDLVRRHHFDAIHADQLWMAQYALAASRVASRNGRAPRLILDQHNAVFLVPQRLAENHGNPLARRLLRREAALLERYERRICAQFDEVVWVTDEDRLALAETGNGSSAPVTGITIPICVDPDEKAVVQRVPDAQRVTFLGGLHWPPNAAGMRWFVDQVWPRVLEQVPRALLTIIGKDPPADFEPAHVPGLEVTGFVPDLAPYLAETAVFIVPLHAGGGMRVKIVDAWSWGLPVVSTTIGAEGLAYRHGENLLLADTVEAFADAVIRIVSKPSLGQRLAARGRATVESCYDWRHVYEAWDDIYGQKT